MFTTKEIISSVTDNLNRPYDTILYNRIRLLVFAEANKLIRQQISKYGFDANYTQEYIIDLEAVDLSESSEYSITSVLRTTAKIPKPIRQKGVPFKYVGAVDRSYPFVYKEAHESQLQRLERRYPRRPFVQCSVPHGEYLLSAGRRD